MTSLDERQAYEAMRAFLVAFWERENRESEAVGNIIRWTDFDNPLWHGKEPTDPAMWGDWIAAVKKVTEA